MMVERILHLEIEGKKRLGFDTGLSPQAFAQAKLAQFIIQEGFIVLPGGTIQRWQPGGVEERQGTMVVWGPDFDGERLDRLVAPAALETPEARRKALWALGRWIAAYPGGGSLWPAGALVAPPSTEGGPYPAGTVFFPPEGLRLRAVQAEGEEVWLNGGESLVCRDLDGEAAASFTAGAMLYRILAAEKGAARLDGKDAPPALPFPARNQDLLHQDMREGVFLPLRLAAPGLDPEAAGLVDQALAGLKGQPPRPPLAAFARILEKPGGPTFFRELEGAEAEKLEEERRRFEKKRGLTVGTRRFVVRNSAILAGVLAALVFVLIIVNSMIVSRRNLPTTAGMDSLQVVETYYGAFGKMDHTLMEACVLNKAGKGDIDMVARYFVTSKVRQAYEYTTVAVIDAKDWFDMGAPPTGLPIFGVTDLSIARTAGHEDAGALNYRVEYILWIPGPGEDGGEDSVPIIAVPGPAQEQPAGTGLAPMAAGGPEEFIPPRGYPFTDELNLVLHKGNWRISNITRNTGISGSAGF
ncbi:MAG: hypothetical protein LBH51_04895 [Treponema sp.]|nr:hypothetical protein [Treponema sp.]